MTRHLIANRAICPDGTLLHSKHRHDYVWHGDHFLDGGTDYQRCSPGLEDVSVYSDDPHTLKREFFVWGTRGPNGDQPLQWVKLKDMAFEHIEAVLATQKHIPEHIRQMFKDELDFEWRK